MAQIKMTIKELEELVSRLKNRAIYGSMKSFVLIDVRKQPSGTSFVEFEQPCEYPECTSEYHRFEGGE
ncbi:hypothetical protein Ga0466249_002779 [Sporomusaceae bacterium BoRhaA]|uniref:hypothetical protein n=1 Tax=Pelorhabdus rhamnosifermentans TaxID=2772457 RepID=UPI001C06206E|nr:hypothetical protein [Pelorhabdus rhamnosifermentans]MBU2701660.1 hypothetical protein [Pelorhabdus rhamnosifermentans]